MAPFESLLERDCQTVLSADFRIKAFAVQSHQLQYWVPEASKAQTSCIYTPDICALLQDNRPVVIEVKHSSFLRRESWTRREPHIRRAYAEDHGVAFLILTEREIRVQPRLSNFQIMLRHRHPMDDVEAEIAARDALSQLAVGSCIGDICEASLLRGNHLRRTYSAILRLALRGEMTLDMNKPLSLSTTISGESKNG